jgi:AraC-like DNA-binding protein
MSDQTAALNEAMQPNDLHLNYNYSGSQICTPGHSYGPALRDHYLIHYIHGGRGTFTADGRTYALTGKNGFLICPGVKIHYKADDHEPWRYTWVAFKGEKVGSYLQTAGLSKENPIFRCDQDLQMEECLKQMEQAKTEAAPASRFKLAGLTYVLFSLLISSSYQAFSLKRSESHNRMEAYIEQAVDFIYRNYTQNIKVNDIANYVRIDRRYLSRLFKNYLDSSPHDMLIQFRMRKACELMTDMHLSIGDVARSVGYEDPMQFSKVFKRVHGTSPFKYRARLKI